MNSNFHGDLIAKNEKHDKMKKEIKSLCLTGKGAIINRGTCIPTRTVTVSR